MNSPWNAPISDRFSSLCARVFSPAAAILESEKTLGTRLEWGRLPLQTPPFWQFTFSPSQFKHRTTEVVVYSEQCLVSGIATLTVYTHCFLIQTCNK